MVAPTNPAWTLTPSNESTGSFKIEKMGHVMKIPKREGKAAAEYETPAMFWSDEYKGFHICKEPEYYLFIILKNGKTPEGYGGRFTNIALAKQHIDSRLEHEEKTKNAKKSNPPGGRKRKADSGSAVVNEEGTPIRNPV